MSKRPKPPKANPAHSGDGQLRIIGGQWRSRQFNFPDGAGPAPNAKPGARDAVQLAGALCRRGQGARPVRRQRRAVSRSAVAWRRQRPGAGPQSSGRQQPARPPADAELRQRPTAADRRPALPAKPSRHAFRPGVPRPAVQPGPAAPACTCWSRTAGWPPTPGSTPKAKPPPPASACPATGACTASRRPARCITRCGSVLVETIGLNTLEQAT